MKGHLSGGVLALAALAFAACGGGGGGTTAGPAIDPADFQAEVDNPFFPLSSPGTHVFEGEEIDPETGQVIKTGLESAVLPETALVVGVEVTVLQERSYENGELVESTLDYFAQHRDGSVYYFGERVDEYEGGRLVGHGGQWLAGEGENRPGVFMPAQPGLGEVFSQERAPGVAEDRSQVVALGQTVASPAGTFTGCIQTRDHDPLTGVTEHKYYCPGVGLVREEFDAGHLDLISY